MTTTEVEPNREFSDEAVPRTLEQPWMSLAEWRSRHEAHLLAPARGQARLALVGDSITQMWADTEAYQALLPYQPLNLGIGGDQTQHVLWRIARGGLRGTSPTLVVVLIGVNNLGNGHTPTETVRGIIAVVAAIKYELPLVKILLLAILPTGATANDPMRQQVREANQLLAQWAPPTGVQLQDIGAVFIESDGRISADTMADGLHPTPKGFELMTQAVLPLIEEALGTCG